MAWTSPRTWVAGETVTASLMNTHVRDNLKAVGDTWTSFTPVWTGTTTNPVIGNGTMTGAYMQAGKFVTFRIRILMGSTTTYGSGAYRLNYPVTAAGTFNPGLSGWTLDTSGGVPNGILGIGLNTTLFRMATTSSNSYIASTVPMTYATGDEINIGGTYEAA